MTTATEPLAIGFIGLGIMGGPMALRLVRAGHDVTVYNRTSSRCEPLVAAGARPALSPREAAEGAQVVISIVTDSPDARAVLLGPEGAARGASPGTLFIDMSTIAPAAAREIGAGARAQRLAFLDAPVTGGDVGAREGTLSILVGGDAADLERARPVLSVLGKRITHCGPLGAGQTVKACNQILCALNMVGIVEALHLCGASGIPAATMLEALIPGAGGSWALEKLGPRIAAGRLRPGLHDPPHPEGPAHRRGDGPPGGPAPGRHRHRQGLLPGQRGGGRGQPGHPGHVQGPRSTAGP